MALLESYFFLCVLCASVVKIITVLLYRRDACATVIHSHNLYFFIKGTAILLTKNSKINHINFRGLGKCW